jgi:hypothetical protein
MLCKYASFVAQCAYVNVRSCSKTVVEATMDRTAVGGRSESFDSLIALKAAEPLEKGKKDLRKLTRTVKSGDKDRSVWTLIPKDGVGLP